MFPDVKVITADEVRVLIVRWRGFHYCQMLFRSCISAKQVSKHFLRADNPCSLETYAPPFAHSAIT